jgi:hypothetical protein
MMRESAEAELSGAFAQLLGLRAMAARLGTIRRRSCAQPLLPCREETGNLGHQHGQLLMVPHRHPKTLLA